MHELRGAEERATALFRQALDDHAVTVPCRLSVLQFFLMPNHRTLMHAC